MQNFLAVSSGVPWIYIHGLIPTLSVTQMNLIKPVYTQGNS